MSEDRDAPASAMPEAGGERGLTARIVEVFITSKLSILLLIASLLAGAAALILTPREEEPQIIVPVADVLVDFPGASAEEVEKLVATPLEAKLREIDGVEYVYSASRPGGAVVTVRYYVGEDRERSLVKTWNKLMSNQDLIPPGVTRWLVKPIEIDDVPIVLLNLSSADPLYGSAELRRIADELLDKLGRVDEVGKTWVVGGERRRISVYPDPVRLAAHEVTLDELLGALKAANVNLQAGRFERAGREVQLEVGPHLQSAEEVGAVLVTRPTAAASPSETSGPVYVRDVAAVRDGLEEAESYTRIGFGPAVARMRTVRAEAVAAKAGEEREAVTLAITKRKGSNAVKVAEEVLHTVEDLRGKVIPQDIMLTVTRDYGETANHKVNELVKHLWIAIATILVLLALSLGIKEAFIVALAVPMTLAVTLLMDLIFGYTINRVTLFALILSLGLLVDDPIVDVENIFRHFKRRREPPLAATLTAVDEVRPPTVFATFTVIVSFLPMFFITGMMGPYMAPMAFNVPIAMLVSLLVAFTVTPWASYYLLKGEYEKNGGHGDGGSDWSQRVYRALLGPLLETPRRARLFLLGVFVALVAASLLAVTRAVPLKLLPFDNKNELQILIDMPRGTTLEATDAVARELGHYLATVAEVTDYESYVGLASPLDFNGMVRHYYLRRGGHVGDIRLNLLPKDEREQQSHEIALRIRPDIERIAKRFGANLKIIEMPPGPPVLSTVVAEVYGPPEARYADLTRVAKRVREDFEKTEGVVDVDEFAEAAHEQVHYELDRQMAAQHGITVAQVADTLSAALAGVAAGIVHVAGERLPLEITLRLPRALRSSVPDLLALRVRSASGALVPLSEIGQASEEAGETTIYHKNLKRMAVVIGEMAGRSPVEAVVDLKRTWRERPLPEGYTVDLAGEGEWKITVDVFRDLGLAFAAALAMIYVLLVAQTGSLGLPLIIMVAIPLTVIGIMPGFWLLNLFAAPIGEYANPVLFTATGMIGMIALAGIVVRNSIILIDFIERLKVRPGHAGLAEAILEAGATRLRPIFLTAGAAMFGSFVITLDPIFAGLAWSFIFGIFASTAFSLLVVPVVYFLIYRE
ncbi:MAG: efflux RND transporter permease subunit [Chromatiales bacterium]